MKRVQTFSKNADVTLYFAQAFRVARVEAKAITIKVAQHAQYPAAVIVSWVMPRKRKWESMVQTSHVDLLVLDGWNHFEPPSGFTPDDRSTPGLVCSRSVYSSFDPAIREDFNRAIAPYIEQRLASVLVDFRGHSAYQMPDWEAEKRAS